MTDPRIGQYVVRYEDGHPVTRAHLVESVVAEDAFTRCGRRLQDTRPTGTELRYYVAPPIRICAGGCAPTYGNDPIPEDI